jgi:phosphopantothenoylcysteine decarboxylase/phosphopantothenate--cysteine ligase
VEDAAQMLDAVLADPGEIFIGCAAVADYRPLTATPEKMKKHAERLSIELVRNPDILAAVAALPERPFCVGFAAETEHLESYARCKLEAKGLDMIAANWVGERACGGGFNSEENALQLFWKGGAEALTSAPKTLLAHRLMAVIAERYLASQ